MPDPTPQADAAAEWQEKLGFLLKEEARLSDPAQKHTVRKQIQEAEERIRELSVEPPAAPPPRDAESERHTRHLKQLYQRKKELTLAGDDVTAVLDEIKDVRRLLRRGPILHPGDLLADGRFELDEAVGQGGFATVWKAWDAGQERVVALKVLHSHHAQDRSRRDRFFRGARKMAELRHPNVVAVLGDEHEDDGWLFFVMEHVPGPNLEQAVRAGRLTRTARLAVLRQVGEALAFAHGRGVVHRDVKPSNVLLDGAGVAKLTDFDLVRADDTTGFTATRAMLGTLQFAAPEALDTAAKAGVRADVYSLASTAVFVLLDGRLPSIYYRDPARVIADLPQGEALRQALTRATAFGPEERFASVRELCEALDGAWSADAGVEEELPSSEPATSPGEVDEGPLGMRFRHVPAGRFRMGSPEDEPGRYDDEIPHEVELTRGFWLGETPVTQGQWRQVMGNNPSHFSEGGNGCPVERVSWYDAVAFANRLSEMAGLEKCYELDCTGTPGESGYECKKVGLKELNGPGYRLPTEAEWERAVRAGRDTALYTGEITIEGHSPQLDPIAWYDANSGNRTHPVRGKKPNDWGLFDMLGNVWEWCGDAYAKYPTEAQTDPFVQEGSGRVRRGGSWGSDARDGRAAYRYPSDPSDRWGSLGFRLARGQGKPGRSPGK